MKPLLANAADMGVSRDGSLDDGHFHSDTEMPNRSALQTPRKEKTPSIVYVSVTDPIGEPAFKPSKTKPLPSWMHLLPSNVYRERGHKANAEVRNDQNFHDLEHIGACYSSDGSEDYDRDASLRTSISDSISPVETGPAEIRKQDMISVDIPGQSKTRATKPFDALPRREYINGEDTNKTCQQDKSNDMTTHGYPYSHPSKRNNHFPRTPYPDSNRPSLKRTETRSYFSHRPSIGTEVNSNADLCCVLKSEEERSDPARSGSSVHAETPGSKDHFPLPAQSSEYLERYNPKTPEVRYEKYVASQPDLILNKIKRQRVGTQAAEFSDDKITRYSKDSKRNWKGVKLTDEEFGGDPRREDLNKELRNLFRGE